MKNKKQFKQCYLLGDMLYKGSTLLRAKEAEELRAIGIPLYSAGEQNKDGDINDKANQTVESNNDLHAHIFKKDIDNIMASDLIIANPERFAEGSICELGAVEMFNHIWKVMNSIIDSDLRDGEKVDLLAQWLENNPYKTTYVHLADIRCTDLPESGYNRSFMMNQFTRGCSVAVQTGVRGVPVSQGGIDVMSWEEIIEDLKEVTGFEEEQEQEEVIDGFMILPNAVSDAVRTVLLKANGVLEDDIEDIVELEENVEGDICVDETQIKVGDTVRVLNLREMLLKEDGFIDEDGDIIFEGSDYYFDMEKMKQFCGQEFIVDDVEQEYTIIGCPETAYALRRPGEQNSIKYMFTDNMIEKVVDKHE